MSVDKESLKPVEGAARPIRQRIGWRGELILVLLPTLTMLAVLGLVETLTRQRLLFASLASSAFLIYLDPLHATNSMRVLAPAQLSAAAIGALLYTLLGPGYLAGAFAMVLTIGVMILFDIVHPPAIATALAFALREGAVSNLLLFGLAVGVTVWLILLEQITLRLSSRVSGRDSRR